jgi:hypothetical protein
LEFTGLLFALFLQFFYHFLESLNFGHVVGLGEHHFFFFGLRVLQLNELLLPLLFQLKRLLTVLLKLLLLGGIDLDSVVVDVELVFHISNHLLQLFFLQLRRTQLLLLRFQLSRQFLLLSIRFLLLRLRVSIPR